MSLIDVLLLLIALNQVYSYKGGFNSSLYVNIDDLQKIIKNSDPSNFQSNNEKVAEAFNVNPSTATQQSIINLFRRNKQSALTFDQLCEFYGYQCDLHFVTTEDGYILQLYRLYNPNVTNLEAKPEPFFLIHGTFGSCNQWISNGNQSMGFFLADKGFVVWAINDRGSSYSVNHTHLNPYTDAKFWDFTFVEMAMYDIPATVKYIQNATGYKKMQVLGHFQGSMILFVLLSTDPSFSQNFDLIYVASPGAYLGNAKGLINSFLRYKPYLNIFGSVRGPFPPARPILTSMLSFLCSLTITQPICIEILSGIQGFDIDQYNLGLIDSTVTLLDQTSFKNMAHLLQTVRNDHIRRYDYGRVVNLEKYNSTEPSSFNYGNIPTEKLVILNSLNDYIATEIDIQKLRNSLKGPPLEDVFITNPLAGHFEVSTALQENLYYNEVIYDIYLRHSDKNT